MYLISDQKLKILKVKKKVKHSYFNHYEELVQFFINDKFIYDLPYIINFDPAWNEMKKDYFKQWKSTIKEVINRVNDGETFWWSKHYKKIIRALKESERYK